MPDLVRTSLCRHGSIMTNAFTSSGLFGAMFSDAEIANAFSAAALLQHAIAFEVAWTETLVSVGAIDPKNGEAAITAIHQRAPDVSAMGAASDVDGLPLPEIVSQLREGLPEAHAQAIHTGATSQDVIDTAMVLILLDVLKTIEARLTSVIAALARQSEDADGAMMGRTRMQAAQPIPVAARLHSWATPLRDHLERLDGLRAQVGQVQLGGPVGLRTFPEGQADAAAMELARRLGLRMGPVWHSNRTPMLDVGHWLTLVSGSLGKIGQDVLLMAQPGIDELALSGGGASSAMPHKQNPILAEAIVTLARFVGVQQGGLAQALIHEQERSGTAWALEWMLLPPMAEATAVALRHADVLLGQIDRIGAPNAEVP